ncbi:MAG: hypothetical protein M5U34_43150 [Chloroflexi bacterium]|nr:hypothetical protein [Chloroflexota bacterium]
MVLVGYCVYRCCLVGKTDPRPRERNAVIMRSSISASTGWKRAGCAGEFLPRHRLGHKITVEPQLGKDFWELHGEDYNVLA